MTSPQVDHVTNIYGFISNSISSVTTKFGRRVDQHLQLHLYSSYDDIPTPRSPDYKPYNNHTSQKGRPACTDLTLQVIMTWPQLGLTFQD